MFELIQMQDLTFIDDSICEKETKTISRRTAPTIIKKSSPDELLYSDDSAIVYRGCKIPFSLIKQLKNKTPRVVYFDVEKIVDVVKLENNYRAGFYGYAPSARSRVITQYVIFKLD